MAALDELYRDGFQLQRAIETGEVREDQVSDKGRLTLALIRRQVKAGDLTRQGRELLGIPIPFTERAWDFAKSTPSARTASTVRHRSASTI